MNEIAENESKDQEQNAGARRSNVNLEVKYISLHLQGPEGWRAAVRRWWLLDWWLWAPWGENSFSKSNGRK